MCKRFFYPEKCVKESENKNQFTFRTWDTWGTNEYFEPIELTIFQLDLLLYKYL